MGVRRYRLTVEGELGDGARSVFAQMAVVRDRGTTTLEGPVRDQAELHGLLQRVRDLGLPLLDVALVEAGTASHHTPAVAPAPESHG